jgi:membrane protease YdiL (CAAX protease family)
VWFVTPHRADMIRTRLTPGGHKQGGLQARQAGCLRAHFESLVERIMSTAHSTEVESYLDWSDKGKPSFWRYALGFLLSVLVFFFLSGIGLIPLALLAPDYEKSLTLNIVAILLSFVVAFFAIPGIVQLLHRRPYWSVALPRLRFEQWNFFTGFAVSIVVGLLATWLLGVANVMPLSPNPDFDLAALVPIAIIGLVGIFIQAASEEMLFRGYFTQFARRFTGNKYIFLGIPALLFALPHIANIAALGGGILVLVPYLISGLLYGWFAWKSGSLWMAIGLHLANNFSSLVLVGTVGDALPSAAPLLVEVPGLALTTLVVLGQSLGIFLVLAFLMKRRSAKRQLT